MTWRTMYVVALRDTDCRVNASPDRKPYINYEYDSSCLTQHELLDS